MNPQLPTPKLIRAQIEGGEHHISDLLLDFLIQAADGVVPFAVNGLLLRHGYEVTLLPLNNPQALDDQTIVDDDIGKTQQIPFRRFDSVYPGDFDIQRLRIHFFISF